VTEIRYDKSHHAGGTADARISNRLRPSTAPNADHVATKGTGPTRVVHAVHDHGQGAGAGRGPRVGDKS
jgi:hypothetical protein